MEWKLSLKVGEKMTHVTHEQKLGRKLIEWKIANVSNELVARALCPIPAQQLCKDGINIPITEVRKFKLEIFSQYHTAGK